MQPTCYPCDCSTDNDDGGILGCSSRYGKARTRLNSTVGSGLGDYARIMTTKHGKMNTAIPTNLIAPCGMNCRLCWGFVRERDTCPGCRGIDREPTRKSKYRKSCRIKNCDQLSESGMKYCSEKCGRFPCARLKQLDKRYRARYGMSMLDNLKMIGDSGVRDFIRREKTKWICPECGELLSVHRPACRFCGHAWHQHAAAQQPPPDDGTPRA